ncbi:MAG: hypothetical protein ACK5QX_07985 [bacterium]
MVVRRFHAPRRPRKDEAVEERQGVVVKAHGRTVVVDFGGQSEEVRRDRVRVVEVA